MPTGCAEPAHMHNVLIVVPCYNEQARLRTEDFTGFASEHPTVGFVFVNDGSTDDTLRILRDLCASAPRQFRYIDTEHGGKGKAVRHGLEEAMRSEGVRYVGYWDADLSTPLDAIVSLTDVLDRLPSV